MIGVLTLVLSLAQAASAPGAAESGSTPPAYAACRAALRGVSSNGPFRLAQPDARTICFSGKIEAEGMAALRAAVERAAAGEPLDLVVSSSGGSVGPALDVAEVLLRRPATVITGPVCASSCANYLFLPARTRVVAENSLLIFHGGMSEGFVKRAREALSRAREPQARTAAETTLNNALRDRVREQAMLRAIGADPRFFEFFDNIHAGPGSQFRRDCRGRRSPLLFAFSPEALKRMGVAVSVYNGPTSEAEVRAAATGVQGESICYWR